MFWKIFETSKISKIFIENQYKNFEKNLKKVENFPIFSDFFRNLCIDCSMKIFEIFGFSKISEKCFFGTFSKNVFHLKEKYIFSGIFFYNVKFAQESKNNT